MRPSLAVTRLYVETEIRKLEEALQGVVSLPAQTQYLVAEILLIRATSVFETAIAEVAYKIAAGAYYLDGSIPSILFPCRSLLASRNAMLNHGRNRAMSSLKWTRAKFIRSSTEFVIDPNDHYQQRCSALGGQISELFIVRNYAAHRSASSRRDFKSVISNIYGRPRKMYLGQFLLSKNYVAMPNLIRYLIEIKAIIDDVVKK